MSTQDTTLPPSGQFRKKPVVIDAWRIDFQNKPLPEWVNDAFRSETIDWCPAGEGLYINTLEGLMKGGFGDYLIRGVKCELYACKADIFEATYEVAAIAAQAQQTSQEVSDSLLTGQAQHLISALMSHGLLASSLQEDQYLKLWDVVKRQLKCVNREGARAAVKESLTPQQAQQAQGVPSGAGELDPHQALEFGRLISSYSDSFNGQQWGGICESVDRKNLAVALDHLTEAGAMLMNLAGRLLAAKVKTEPVQAQATANFADGDSPCVLEWGAVSLSIGDQSRITEMKLCPTLWDAIAEGALCGFDWRVYPMAISAPQAEPARRLSPFDAVAEAMRLASLMGGSIGMSDVEKTKHYEQRLRSHLAEFIYPPVTPIAPQAEPKSTAKESTS